MDNPALGLHRLLLGGDTFGGKEVNKMKIQLFENMKGMIHGSDPKRIGCDRDGVLRIGTAKIKVSSDSIMPVLFYGATGDYDATFTDNQGAVYPLEKVAVRNGRIDPPSKTDLDILELRCKLESAEKERCEMQKKICVLEQIFDTNSLNFLIKGETNQ